MKAEDALDLIARRTALRLSLYTQRRETAAGVTGSFVGREDEWERDLADVEAQLVEAGLLKDVGGAELGEVVTLKGKNFHTESEATEPSPAPRPCAFCNDTGEKVVDMEIDGFTYEVTVDCFHPYDLP